jgi:hypothetical protein
MKAAVTDLKMSAASEEADSLIRMSAGNGRTRGARAWKVIDSALDIAVRRFGHRCLRFGISGDEMDVGP